MKMKIFFTASLKGKALHQESYHRIVQSIIKSGEDIISLEVGKYEDYLGRKLIKDTPKDRLHYLYVRKGINMANAVIIETSDESFQLGHEATLALLYNKPLLCLAKEDVAEKIRIYDPKFKVTFYKDEKEVDGIVSEFLTEVRSNNLSVRFNAKLSPIEKNFLDWYAEKSQKNSSQVIRDLIDKMITEHPEFLEDFSFIPTTS